MKRISLALLTITLLAVVILTALISVQSVSSVPLGIVDQNYSYTKLMIIPKSKHFMAKPGDEFDFSVKIKNMDNRTVTIKPKLIPPPFPGINTIDESWVRIEPSEMTLNPNEEKELKVEITIPKDIERGSYSAQIALTNETVQVPYSPYPMYPNSIHVSIFVQVPPSVIIYPRLIYDKVEPGKTYTYNITIENTGNATFAMNPKLTLGEFYAPEGKVSYLTRDMVEIIAPKEIPPHSKVTVNVKVSFPEDASGSYRGCIDLNINDPNLEEWMQKVDLSFTVRAKPSKPFVKVFDVYNVSKLNISITAMNYDGSVSDVDIKIYSPSGLLNVNPTKIIESIKVTPQSSFTPIPYPKSTVSGEYKVSSWTKTFVYSIESPENGKWRIEVLSACDCITIRIEKDL